MKPSIRLEGNGQGWLATYSTSPTVTPASSNTSRAHGLLDRLPRLDEAGEGREAALGPVHLAAQQRAVLVVRDQHDHGGVGARVVLGAAGLAAADVAGRRDDGALAAA